MNSISDIFAESVLEAGKTIPTARFTFSQKNNDGIEKNYSIEPEQFSKALLNKFGDFNKFSKKFTDHLLDWPDDLCQLADQLGIDKFYVLGASGGGPYVAACAYKIPDRLLGATIIAGLSPMANPKTKEGMRFMNRLLLPMGKSAPWLLGLVLKMARASLDNPKNLERMLSDLPDVDKALFSGEVAEHILAMGQESFYQGIQGAKVEGRIYAEPWGFELDEISTPVSIWQGTLDVNVPLSNGRIFATEIPNATAHFIEGEGHLSLIINHSEAILNDLLH